MLDSTIKTQNTLSRGAFIILSEALIMKSAQISPKWKQMGFPYNIPPAPPPIQGSLPLGGPQQSVPLGPDEHEMAVENLNNVYAQIKALKEACEFVLGASEPPDDN